MEEYTQITLNEWMEWKEDIRRKLAETAGNFVHIGYRLKQIRDSGMYDGAADIFEFAKKEYGLGKSTVSRFIAINERYSEGGNSLELREEYKAFSSSKLAEMLTLPEADCELITERTTIKEIRELKEFERQTLTEEAGGQREEMPGGMQEENVPDRGNTESEDAERTDTPLQKCIRAFFEPKEQQETLNALMDILLGECGEEGLKRAAELVNPGDYRTFKKGIIFLFLYDYETGVKYKSMTGPEPVSMTWAEFLREILELYIGYAENADVWAACYGKKTEKPAAEEAPEKQEETGETQGISKAVATSQQEPQSGPECPAETEEQIPGQDSIENHPEWLPEGYKSKEESAAESGEEEKAINKEMLGDVRNTLSSLNLEMRAGAYKAALASAKNLVHYLEKALEG